MEAARALTYIAFEFSAKFAGLRSNPLGLSEGWVTPTIQSQRVGHKVDDFSSLGVAGSAHRLDEGFPPDFGDKFSRAMSACSDDPEGKECKDAKKALGENLSSTPALRYEL